MADRDQYSPSGGKMLDVNNNEFDLTKWHKDHNTTYQHEVAAGNVEGSYLWNKFGYNLDVDSGSEEIISSWGGAFDPNTDIITTAQTFDIAYDGTAGGSTDGAGTTGATQLFFTYLDEDFTQQTAVHVLGADGTDTTSFSGVGINRVVVLANGGLGWNASDITVTATTDSTTQAQIPAMGSVTQQSIFHSQVGFNFMADYLRVNILKLSGGSAPKVTIKAYSWSRVTSTRYEVFRDQVDTGVENHIELRLKQPFVIGGREVLYFTASTDVNNTQVKCRFSGIESDH
jgi:hypothetical protein